MDCSKANHLLDSYLDKDLGPAEAKDLERHLFSCSDCREALAEMARTFSLLDELRPVIAPPFFLARVMTRLEKKQPYGGISRLASRLWAPAVGLLGLLSLVLSLEPLQEEGASSPGIMLFPQGFGVSITDPLGQFSDLTNGFVFLGAMSELRFIVGVVLVFVSMCSFLLGLIGSSPSAVTGRLDR